MSSLSPSPARPGASRVLALSTAAFTLMFAVWLMFGVLGVPIKEEFQLSTVQFSWLTAIAVLNGSIWRLPLGIVTDRWGGRRVMTVLMLVCTVPCLLVSVATSYSQLLAYAFLVGLVGNSFSVGVAWNSAWCDRRRQGFALGVFGAGNIGGSITKLCGPLLIGLVPAAGLFGGQVPGGWRFVPLMYAVALVLMAGVLWVATPKRDSKPSTGRTMRAMLAPLKTPRVWRFGVYYTLLFGGFVALSLWLPNYYKSVYHLPLERAALLSALFIFSTSLMRPVGGWLADRFGARPLMHAVLSTVIAVSLPLTLPGALAVPLGLFATLTVFLGLALGVGNSTVYKYITAYFPNDVGAVGGLVGTLGALGGFVLPLAFGYVSTWTRTPQTTFMILVALGVGCLSWLRTVVTARKAELPLAIAEGGGA